MSKETALVASARDAMEVSDWASAYAMFQEAAAAGELGPDELEDLARSAWWSGKPEACISAREQAFAGHTRAGAHKRAAMVALALAEDSFHARTPTLGRAWLQRAERLLEQAPESVEHGWLTRTQAVIAFEVDNDLERALELASRAHDAGVAFGDRDLEAITLHDQGRITVARGDVTEGMALMDEAMVAAVSGELGALYTGKIYCNMIDICEQLADYRRASDWSDAAKRWCDRAGHSSGFPGVCRIHRAEIMRLRGDWESAEAEATRAADEVGNFVDFAGEAFYEIGQIRLHMGDFEHAEAAFRQAHGLGRDPQPGMALLQLARGNVSGAEMLIDQSLGEASAPLRRARLLPARVEIALAGDRLDEARRAADELAAVAHDYGSPALLAGAEHALGSVLLAEGSTAEAAGRLRTAAEAWRENDFPYQAARSRLLLGDAYRQSGKADLARLELAAALAAFEELGAMTDVKATRRARDEAEDYGDRGARRVATLMFTDIVDSTALIAVIGDAAWEQLLGWHHRTLRSIFAGHGGHEVENTGDGFFVAFDSPQAAVRCAVEIQHTLRRHREEQGFAPEVRIGLHAGEVTDMASTLAGEDVHKAARICAHAAGGEILVSAQVATALGPVDGEQRSLQLKGLPGETSVISIPWM